MEMFENPVEVGSQLSSVQEFYEFLKYIHKMFGCQDSECDIAKFFTPMKDVIFDPNKDYDYKRNFFMAQAVKVSSVFGTLFQLKNNEQSRERVQNLIEGLNKTLKLEELKEEQKRVTKEIDVLLNKISKDIKPTEE